MAKNPTEIRVEPRQYPNGERYFRVTVGNNVAGSFSEHEDGYVVTNCRKTIDTIELAAREVIWRYVQRQLKEAARFSAALDLPVTVDAVARAEE